MRILEAMIVALFALAGFAFQAHAQAPLPGAMVGGQAHLVIYHVEGRRSERIVWFAEELGIPYELKFRRGDVQGSFDDIRKVNPGMPVAPTVIYDGQLLVESAAIMQLILEREGKGRLAPAAGSPDYAAYLMFMYFAEGSFAADVVGQIAIERETGKKADPAKETDAQRAMRLANDFLATHKYFGGADFSTADIMMLFPSTYAIRSGIADAAKYPHLIEWQARVQERPAFKRMVAAARTPR
jgi:glutathione S-transferase